MENGISIFIGTIAALATYFILWIVYLKPKQTRFETERDKAKQLNATLTTQRDTANEEKAALEIKLENEAQRSADFESKLEVAKQSNAVLHNRMRQEEQRSAALEIKLENEEQRSADFESKLEVANRRIVELDSQLDAEKQRSAKLDNQLNVANRRISELDGALGVANRRIGELRIELQQVAQSNDNAIQLLYLSTLSLQACGIALRRELDRSQRYDEEYRDLTDKYNDLLDNYQDFSEEIKGKARQRLVRKGIGVVLAFVPGLALIDILGDLGDILDVATEADEAVDGLHPVASDDIVKSVAPSSVAPEVSESGMPVEGIGLLPFVPKAQTGIEDTLPQTVSAESTTQGPSNLDAFVTDMLKYMEDLVNSLKNTGEYQETAAIAKMISNLQKLGYKLHYPSPTTQNRRSGKSK